MRSFLCALYVFLCSLPSAMSADAVSFRSEIAPVLLEHCQACHNAKKAEGGYRVDTFAELQRAGDSGENPVSASDPAESELWRRIASSDPSERMPAESDALPAAQQEVIKNWIAAGAKFDGEADDQPLLLVVPPRQYPPAPATYTHPLAAAALLFTPDRQHIVVGGYHELLVWDVSSGQLVRRISNVGQRIFAFALASDGVTLAVGGGEPGKSGEVRLVNMNSGEIGYTLGRTHDVVLDVAFRPGTTHLAVAAADGLIRIIDTESQQLVRTVATHADWVTSVAWSTDGQRLISGSRDKSAKVYSVESGELLSSYVGHGAAVRGVALLADGKQAVSSGGDGKLHRWEIEGAKKAAEVPLGGEGYKLIVEGQLLFVPVADKRLVSIDLSSNKIAQTYAGHSDWVISAAVQAAAGDGSPERLVAAGSHNGEVRVWKLSDAASLANWLVKP